jgi:murein L,D-transpeptidase YafK
MLLALLLGTLVVASPAPDDSGRARIVPARPDSVKPVLAAPILADRILVEKSLRRLTLMRGGIPVRQYAIALGQNPVGHKERRGDMRTPEGTYRIEARVDRSRFHLALRISYPNAEDLARAREQDVSPGGDIMIHGLPNGQSEVGAAHREFDWTEGCIAVTDEEIEEIWRAAPLGTVIEIRP